MMRKSFKTTSLPRQLLKIEIEPWRQAEIFPQNLRNRNFRENIYFIKLFIWKVTEFLITFLEVTNYTTLITFGILGFAFFLMFTAAWLSALEAQLCRRCRTGILFARSRRVRIRSGSM